MQYDPNKLKCARQDIYEWYLDQVRRLAIGILPMNHAAPKDVDIAIGSSGLLYAVESRLDELQYRGSVFDESRLIPVDVYETSIIKPYSAAFNSGKDLLLQVSTVSPNDKTLLAKVAVLGKSLADAAKVPRYRLNLVSIRVCSVSATKVKRQTKLREPYVCQVDILDGPEQDLVASIDLIEDLVSGSLIGQPLEKIGQFDFDLNPFAQPAGLGCGHQSRAEQDRAPSSKTKSFKAASNQFSFEYFSLEGSEGLAFVAFDGERQVMRHDRGGRKNVYDLRRGRSYHVNEFHSMGTMFDGGQAKNCVELEIGDDMLLMDESISVIARLLGVDFVDEANYIGSKTINEETFGMYELELEQGKNSPDSFNLPIVMEPDDFVMPYASGSSSGAKRRHKYFLTYYVLEILKDSSENKSSSNSRDEPFVKIPRFAELWELSDETTSDGSEVIRKRSLINLLEFTQFSWSLNIEPEEAPSSSGGGGPSRLFSLDSCACERSQQLLLSFNTVYSEVPADLIRANRQQIREEIHKKLATSLDIPRLNLLSLDFQFSPPYTGIWMVRARIAELVRGISQDKLVGHVQFDRSSNWLLSSQLFAGENRHSYDQCKLDSLALPGTPNPMIVYCPGLTLCLLVDSNSVQEHSGDLCEKGQANKIRSGHETDAICEVHQFSWRPVPAGPHSDSMLSRVLQNKNRITMTNFEVELSPPPPPPTDTGRRAKPVTYRGFGLGVKVQMLDDTVGQPRGKSPLVGLRYLAASEDKEPTNSNYAYKMSTKKQDSSFGQCHMACQMDEFCESFSVCKPPISGPATNADNYDCVLSTMRLTQNKVNELADRIGKASGEDLELSIEVQPASLLPTEDGNSAETYKFQRDLGCSLHPKDILAQFKATKALDLPLDLDSTGRDLLQVSGADVVSLDECAGIANEAALLESNSVEAEFVYCPLESLCLSSQLSFKAKSHAESSNSSSSPDSNERMEKCFAYTKSHFRNFYDHLLFHKVALKLNGTHALEDDSVQEIGRLVAGLSLEQCARDCNLQQANCLAFDLCEFEANVTTCTLWTIRSPLEPKTKAGYLPGEQRFYANASNSLDSATLVENGKCAHFYLKNSYFQLKLNHMLQVDQQVQRQKLNELEDRILNLDSRMGDDMVMQKILGFGQNSSTSAGAKNSKAADEAQRPQVSADQSSSSWLTHFGLILTSGVLGALGYAYAGEAYSVTADAIEYLRARRGQRFAAHRISQLNLPNHQEL